MVRLELETLMKSGNYGFFFIKIKNCKIHGGYDPRIKFGIR